MTVSDPSECIKFVGGALGKKSRLSNRREICLQHFFFFAYVGDRMILSFLQLALSATTDKLLNHSNRGMSDILPGVTEKIIGLLSFLPTDDQLLP